MKILILSILTVGSLAAQSVSIGPPVFAGVGLNDATSAGAFIGPAANHQYAAVICTAATPDTVKFSRDGGSFTGCVSVTGAAQLMRYPAGSITAASWATGRATYTDAGHGLSEGVQVTVSGVTPSGYNQTCTAHVISNSQFSCALVSTPGAYSSGGSVIANDGVTVTWAATTGHTVADLWTIAATASGSAVTSSYISPGVGARFRDAQDKARDVVSVTDFAFVVGNGTYDSTAGIQAALQKAPSGALLIPAGNFKISARLTVSSGQRIYGSGRAATTITQTGTGVDSTAFYVNGATDTEFHGMSITPGTTTSHLVDGWAIFVQGSARVLIDDVEVSGHRRGAFALYNTNYSSITNTKIHDSVVVDNPVTPDTSSTAGNDIYIYGSSSNNQIIGNSIHHGAGFGIGIQTAATGTDVSSYNLIEGNVVDGEGLYGIYLYRSDPADVVWHNSIVNNQVSNISGNIPGPGPTYSFGSGIYIASAEYTLIENNQVSTTNVYQPADRTNGASAINVTGAGDVKVTGNKVYNPGSDSFSDIIAIAPTVVGGVSEWVNNDSWSSTGSACFTIRDIPVLKVNELHCYRSSAGATAVDDQQAFIDQSDIRDYDHLDFDGYNAGVIQSVSVGTIKRTSVTNSVIRGNTSYAALSRGVETNFSNINVHQGTGGVGLGFTSDVTSGRMVHNFIRGGSVCIVNDAGPTFLLDENDTGNPSDAGVCPTAYDGATGVEFILGTSATPTVASGARDFRVPTGTTITDLLHGTPGQEVTLRATAARTVQDTGSIQLAGTHDFVMAANDVLRLKFATSSWFEIGRTVAATISGGTFGDAGHVAQVTVDSIGRVTSGSSIQINIGTSGTFTMRNASGTGTCTMTFVNGGLTSSTC